MAIEMTLAQMLDIFARYNNAIWPMQLVAYALGLVAVFAALRGSGRAVLLILGFFWLWLGIVWGGLYSSQLGVPS